MPNARKISRKGKTYFPANLEFKTSLKAYYKVRKLVVYKVHKVLQNATEQVLRRETSHGNN